MNKITVVICGFRTEEIEVSKIKNQYRVQFIDEPVKGNANIKIFDSIFEIAFRLYRIKFLSNRKIEKMLHQKRQVQ